jgi:hypothetical protein
MAQLPKNIDVSKLRYSEMRTLPSGAKTVYVNYGSEKLTIQTPVLSLPYGLGEPFESKEAAKNGTVIADKDKKYDLTVSFRGLDENPKVKGFHDKLKEIENKVIDDAFTNRLSWFKDDFDGNKSFVSKLLSPIIKVDKDPNTGKPVGKYPPTFKAKLPYDNKNGSFIFDSYDMDNNEIDFPTIMNKLKGAKSQLIVQLTGIWFAGGKYGCSWKIITGKFQLHQNSKICFIEDSDADNATVSEEEEDDDVVDNEIMNSLKLTPNVVPDEDDDEEEEEEEEEEDDEDEVVVPEVVEPVPEPVKPVKKPTKKAAK